tara:strand:- start:564 stop:1205 length:642 start_codon:yes stop_codon:yes gene_type:complete
MQTELEKRIITSLILIPISLFFVIKGSIFFIFFLTIIFFIISSEWLKICKNKTSMKIIGILFFLASIYCTYLIRIEKGINLFLFVVLISILTDIGGYIFGKAFKGPKLTKISPNKTYSGLIGSLILSMIGGICYAKFIIGIIWEPTNILDFLILIVLISSVSQLGDLTISFFKRLAKIKNTGKILPGHGGLLDRLDGIIFAIPVTYLVFTYIK